MSQNRIVQHFNRILSLFSCVALVLTCFAGCGSDDAGGSSSSPSALSSHVGGAGRASSAVSAAASKAAPSPDKPEPSPKAPEATPVPLRAVWRTDGGVYSDPSAENELLFLAAGEEVSLEKTDDPMWYTTTQFSGFTGYLYAENLYRLDQDGTVSSKSLWEEYQQQKFEELRTLLPEGKYWNHMWQDIPYGEETPFLVSDTPCEHSVYGELYCNFYNGATERLFYADTLCQCLGFASLLSDQIFGTDAPLHVFHDSDLLRVGDHIRLHEYEHSMTVLAMDDEFITLAEANQDYEDCLISWTRQISWYELEDLSWDSEYISRYPLCPDGDGGFTAWEDDGY